MFFGHIGFGFAGKSIGKKMPLWLLLIAVMVPDIISYALMALKVSDETGFWSHSFLMNLVYMAIGAFLIYLAYKTLSSVLLFCGLIFSHWLCDFISWPLEVIGMTNGINIFSPDRTYGLGVYRTMTGALICDFGLLIIGVSLYIYRRRMEKHAPPSSLL